MILYRQQRRKEFWRQSDIHRTGPFSFFLVTCRQWEEGRGLPGQFPLHYVLVLSPTHLIEKFWGLPYISSGAHSVSFPREWAPKSIQMPKQRSKTRFPGEPRRLPVFFYIPRGHCKKKINPKNIIKFSTTVWVILSRWSSSETFWQWHTLSVLQKYSKKVLFKFRIFWRTRAL